ncbi:DUF2924 domain-containing protein [Lichenihabitans psoromatis]|uniref:DUF2924 domain-containing protein n=1 Tax=Lichenihabitans psoromatis TaxID=2528642 RepID=UPI001FDEE99C|nr:DUF2924 domain-containing protein [Lichenihabitans psoromatis]
MLAKPSMICPEPMSNLAPTDPDTALGREIASLHDLDLHNLRSRWRQRLRCPAPATLTRPLLLRLLAYRLQAKVLGDLDPEAVRFLDKIAKANARQRDAAEKRSAKAVPTVPPVPPIRGLKPGTLLVREHLGTMHRVLVVADGFTWESNRYTSLSEVARAITGTRWNGPRFFGLRDKPGASSASSETLIVPSHKAGAL